MLVSERPVMNVSDERTVSLWATVKAAPDAVPLMENDQADVIVRRNRQRDDRADNRSPFIDMR